MICSLDIWCGAADAMYRDRAMAQARESGERSDFGDRIVLEYDPAHRGKRAIEEYVLGEVEDSPSLFPSGKAVLIHGPVGESFKEWTGNVIRALIGLKHIECFVTMIVPYMTPKTAPAAISELGGAITWHDFSLPGFERLPGFLVSHFAERGLAVTEKQMRFIRARSDMDPQIIGESFRSLVALGAPTGEVTNDMVKSVIGDRRGLDSVYEMDSAAERGRDAALRVSRRITGQGNGRSLSMQLASASASKYRALLLLKSGMSTSQVKEVTAYMRSDGTRKEMSERQLGYLASREMRSWSIKSLSAAIVAADRALAALKGGEGSSAGLAFVMSRFAVELSDARAA